MSIETLKNQNENSIQESLMELKEDINNPWHVTYLRESNDWKYNIYSYELVQWGNKWWIKNKYINQIWPWVEWTLFTDAWWREINKNRFNAWEIVYLKVPKNKNQNESRNIPWKVEFVGNKKDKENKERKVYSYTLVQWGNMFWVADKFSSQLWFDISLYDDEIYKFFDKNGNRIYNWTEWNTINHRFNRWETVYFWVPNTDIIDPTPTMTTNDIMNISDNDVTDLFDVHDIYWNRHADKLWEYTKINGKKVYLRLFKDSDKWKYPQITREAHETSTNNDDITLFTHVWNKIRWVYFDNYHQIYRWDLEYSDHTIKPKNYNKRLETAPTLHQ